MSEEGVRHRSMALSDRISTLLGPSAWYRVALRVASPSLIDDLDQIVRVARRVGFSLSDVPPTMHEEEEEHVRMSVLSAIRGQMLEIVEDKPDDEAAIAVARAVEGCYNRSN